MLAGVPAALLISGVPWRRRSHGGLGPKAGLQLKTGSRLYGIVPAVLRLAPKRGIIMTMAPPTQPGPEHHSTRRAVAYIGSLPKMALVSIAVLLVGGFTFLGLFASGAFNSSPAGCAEVAAWYKATAKPALATLANDFQQLNTDLANDDSLSLDSPQMQVDGSQLSQDALAVPANFPWSSTGHGNGPAADAGTEWALMMNSNAVTGDAYENGNPFLATDMLKAAQKYSTKFEADLKACGVNTS
jgi:hypothetical protein